MLIAKSWMPKLLLAVACLLLLGQCSQPRARTAPGDTMTRSQHAVALRGGTTAATDIAWINAAGGNWNNAANWQDGTGAHRVPTNGDNVFITLDGTYSVNLDVSPNINSLTLGGASGQQTLSNPGQSLTLNNTSTINAQGLLAMGGGTLNGNGPLVNGGTMTISGSAVKTFNGTTVTNGGTITWTGGGNIDGLNGATFNNSGLFNVATAAGFIASASNAFPIFNNLTGGTFSKPATNGITTVDRWFFNQSGTIAVAGGTTVDFVSLPLTLNDGASFSGAGATRSIGGPFEVPKDATISGDGHLELTTGGRLEGAGSLKLNSNLFDWTGGVIIGQVVVLPHATMNISGGPDKVFSGGTITNNGTITWTGGGNIDGRNGATFNNSGLFNVATAAGFVASASNAFPIFNNLPGGTFSKVGGITTTTVDRWYFNQSGTIAVAGGTTLDFISQLLTINDGARFSGPGHTRSVGGAFNIPSDAMISGDGHLELTTGGTLSGNGVLTLNSNLFDWTGGSLQGHVNVAANATMNISGGPDKVFDGGTITNNGTIMWVDGGNIDGRNGATFNNSGLFNVVTAAGFISSPSNTFPTFNNLPGGTFSKPATNGTTTVDRWFFNQSGTLKLLGDTLRFTGGTGRGSYTQTAGKTDLSGGALAVGAPINLQGGQLVGSGTITGDVVSGGTVSPGHSPGSITITGNYTQTAAGTLAIEIGGTTAGTQFDQLNVGGVATLDGTLNVAFINGFAPTSSQGFTVLTYASHSGKFARLTGSGAQLRPVYGATALTLGATVTPTPTPTPVPGGGACSTPPAGLVAWYRGEGNALDSSGKGNNGIIVGNVPYAAGKVGKAFQTSNGSVRVPNSASLRPPLVSIEAWVAATNPGSYKYIVSKSLYSIGGSYAFYTGSSGGLFFYVRTDAGANRVGGVLSPDAGTAIWDGNLHHIAGTYDGGAVRLYVDGVQVGNGTPTTGTLLYSSSYQNGDVFIGNFNPTSNFFAFPGVIDELSIYNRALSAAEIKAIVNAGSAGKCAMTTPTPTPKPTPVPGGACSTPPAGLVAWYRAEGNANDSSGRGNNGTIVGKVTYAAGKVGKAFVFNGDPRNNVTIPDSPSLRPQSLTIETWVNFKSFTNDGNSIFQKPVGTAQEDSYSLFYQNGALYGDVGALNTSIRSVVRYAFTPILRTWYHFAFTHDSATGAEVLYVNGAPVATNTNTTPIDYDAHPVLIGADINNETLGFPHDGLIDEASLYNRVLSAAEIKAIVNAGSAGKCAMTTPTPTPKPTLTPTPTPTLTPTPKPMSTPTPQPTSGTFSWGDNTFGELGRSSQQNDATPQLVHGLSNVTTVAAGGSHSLAVTSAGGVYAWGYNGAGQLGDGTTQDSFAPVAVSNLRGVKAVAAGWYHSLALKQDGTVWAWGLNQFGQLGDGTNKNSSVPVPVRGLNHVVAVAAGVYFSLALRQDGTVWAWGNNFYGQLGNGSLDNSNTPAQVANLANVHAISAGAAHSVAVLADGGARAWGWNYYGQLGNGQTADSDTPTIVSGPANATGASGATNLAGAQGVAAGYAHTLFLLQNGTVLACGNNAYGQLGSATKGNVSSVVLLVPLPQGVTAVAAGAGHSLALLGASTVAAWGLNDEGQLGDGTHTSRLAPTLIAGLQNIKALAAGYKHSLALSKSGVTAASATAALHLSTARASATRNTVALNFDGALDAEASSDAAHYAVTVNGQAVVVESAAYNGATHQVLLALPDGALQVGAKVAVAWHDLRDAKGRWLANGQTALTAR